MKNKIFFISLIFVLFFSFNPIVFSDELCSSKGYMIIAINGMVTTPEGALYNKDAIKRIVENIPVKENIYVDYIYNATHWAGIGDFLDSANQKIFEKKVVESYDLIRMLSDLSQKVKTQKVLFIAHSQGNFYANNIYDVIASKPGGVPKESLSIYGIGSPASHVAGGGKYITSSNDGIINLIRKLKFLNVLKPNVNIKVLPGDDSSGHNLSRIYLKFEGDRITSEIKSLLNNLKENDEQLSDEPCISPPKITSLNKLRGALFTVTDPIARVTMDGLVGTYKVGKYIVNAGVRTFSFMFNGTSYVAKTIGNLTTTSLASVFNSVQKNNLVEENNVAQTETEPQIILPEENPKPVIKPESVPEIITPPLENILDENLKNTTPVEPEIVLIPEVIPEVIPEIITPTYSTGGGGGRSPAPTVDITAPVISIIGDNPLSIDKNSVYEDFGATAIDDFDSTVTATATGEVDTSVIGTYLITYTSTDFAGNSATLIRTVNVVDVIISDITPPVITLNGNTNEVVLLNSTYIDAGATAEDDVDGVITVDVSSDVDTSVLGNYSVIYTSTDLAGNIATEVRNVKVSTYVYIPKYKFGNQNGDGNDWQVWAFNASNVYEWTNTYVDNYLNEKFKIQSYDAVSSCSSCLQRGVFNKNPQNGFELSDIILKNELEYNPQHNSNGLIYDIEIQWDSTGYDYTISHDSILEDSGRTNITGVDENTWTGWNTSGNNFQTFPSGDWKGVIDSSIGSMTGGENMILEPYPIYVYSGPVSSKEKKITAFSFNELSPVVMGVIDENIHTVSLAVPFGTNITNLVPTILISDKALISPSSGIAQDFTNPVTYTVTAENDSTQDYIVTVTILPDPNAPPYVLSYSLNGLADDAVLSVDSYKYSVFIDIKINVSKNVDWVSIKLENESEPSEYKIFYSGSNCVDGTSTCEKRWDGYLSGGSFSSVGRYRIKLHMKDSENNVFLDYLSPYVVVVTAPF